MKPKDDTKKPQESHKSFLHRYYRGMSPAYRFLVAVREKPPEKKR